MISLAIILFALPFYFGYGNPLPFTSPENTAFDNTWLTVFPLMFIGLAIGWKCEKTGGYLIVLPIAIATIITIIIEGEGLPGPMFFPLILGILYLVLGYKFNKQ